MSHFAEYQSFGLYDVFRLKRLWLLRDKTRLENGRT